MADNTILTSGGMKPTVTDTPLDERTRVENKEDIYNIENAYVGMQVYVKSEKKRYTVRSLKAKEVGGVEIPNAMVDTIADSAEEITTIADKMRVDSESGTLYIL